MKKAKRRTSKNRWREYERLKRDLQARQLSPAEYEIALRTLLDLLKL